MTNFVLNFRDKTNATSSPPPPPKQQSVEQFVSPKQLKQIHNYVSRRSARAHGNVNYAEESDDGGDDDGPALTSDDDEPPPPRPGAMVQPLRLSPPRLPTTAGVVAAARPLSAAASSGRPPHAEFALGESVEVLYELDQKWYVAVISSRRQADQVAIFPPPPPPPPPRCWMLSFCSPHSRV